MLLYYIFHLQSHIKRFQMLNKAGLGSILRTCSPFKFLIYNLIFASYMAKSTSCLKWSSIFKTRLLTTLPVFVVISIRINC
jgi:hypothetical protein